MSRRCGRRQVAAEWANWKRVEGKDACVGDTDHVKKELERRSRSSPSRFLPPVFPQEKTPPPAAGEAHVAGKE